VQSLKSGLEVIHFLDKGPRDDFAIVFLNSLGTDFRVWDKLLDVLGERFRTVRMDKRGHGLSTNYKDDISIESLAKDVSVLVDSLNIKNICVVGLSIGGLIAIELIRQRPHLCNSLILSDTAPKIGSKDMWANRIKRVQDGGIEAISDDILARWFSRSFLKDNVDELQMWRSMLTRTTKAGYIGCCNAISRCDLTEQAKSISIPTLVIVGDEDGSTPIGLVKDAANLIEGSIFKIIKKAGHLPCVEQPNEVASIFLKFLEDNT
jgi:3-oxoadipate enol-lactonase